LIQNRGDGSQHTYLKVQYSLGNRAYQTLDAVSLHDLIVVAKCGLSIGLVETPGWGWIPQYLQQSPIQMALNTVLKNSVEPGRKFKFGVEVPCNPRHALQLDKENGTNA
jgi:hypothetical protein